MKEGNDLTIADPNMTYSSIAREYLLREGLPADRIIKTGSPMYEVLHLYLPKIKASKIFKTLNLEKGKRKRKILCRLSTS